MNLLRMGHLNIVTVIKSTFIAFTILSLIPLFYSVYVYFGVAQALQEIDVSVQNFDVTFLGGLNASVTTVLIVSNPSEFTFNAVSFHQKIYLNGERIGENWLSREHIIGPFSNTSVIMPRTKIFVLQNSTEVSWNWSVSVFINLDTPLPANAPLRFPDLSVTT